MESELRQFDRAIEGGRKKVDVDDIRLMMVHQEPELRIDRMDVADIRFDVMRQFVDVDFEKIALLFHERDLFQISAADALSIDGGGFGEHFNDDLAVMHERVTSRS
jgi:hypothetical protein